jgi:hypothetical protein
MLDGLFINSSRLESNPSMSIPRRGGQTDADRGIANPSWVSGRGPHASAQKGGLFGLERLLRRRKLLDLQAFDRAEVLYVAGEQR